MSNALCVVDGRLFKGHKQVGCSGCAGQEPTVTQTTDRAAVVDKGYHWRLIDERTPRGTKLQLVRRDAGVALYGVLGSDNEFFTHWAPLPTFED